ncbi:hypothetical protein V1514DRAFT_336032, partial [Lipomyces japonicus]|uniref:uncharacterized protein n=1 Tax=Lipomyces japonicus TaxID=56871 RepID=UPI0034CD88B5
MVLQLFLTSVHEATSSPTLLATIFSLDLASRATSIAALRADILNNNRNLEAEIAAQNYYGREWPGFDQLVKSYLTFVCDHGDPDAVYDREAEFRSPLTVLSDLQAAFANRRGVVLTKLVAVTARYVLRSAQSNSYEDKEFCDTATSDTAGILLKIFNSIRADRSSSSSVIFNGTSVAGSIDGNFKPSHEDATAVSKRDVMLLIACLLCRAYFRINQPTACANVFANIRTAFASRGVEWATYPLAQRVTLRYYLGVFYLFRQELQRARAHLQWAFVNCYYNGGDAGGLKNHRAILKYLIPVQILLGQSLSRQAFELAGLRLTAVFEPLARAAKQGDLCQFRYHLWQNVDWLVRSKLFVVLNSKAEILIFRNLFSRIDRIDQQQQQQQQQIGDQDGANAKKKTNDLTFDQLLAGIKLSTRTLPSSALSPQQHQPSLDWTYDDIENVCVSLIDQGFMKANIYTRSKVLRLMPSGGFPPLSQLWPLPQLVANGDEWLT